MAYDEGHAEILRDALRDVPGITEKRMFGRVCLLLNGNMLCGVHKDGAMFRVGKQREAAALAIPGAREMTFTGRRMGGMIDVSDDAMGDADAVAR
ncbi:MAG TPA: TfoX/Sxy family protein [Thermohalobaculum sp.]|nr:TfoX/Sxy family protein [Thermohalobaculum sp.]